MDIIYRCCEAEVNQPFKAVRPWWFNKIHCLETFLIALEKSEKFKVLQIPTTKSTPKSKIEEYVQRID